MNTTEHFLVCLAEEASELSQACAKALRFGLGDRYPVAGDTTLERVVKELNDVQAVAIMMKQRRILPETILGPEAEAVWIEKVLKVSKWLDYSRKIGTLRDEDTERDKLVAMLVEVAEFLKSASENAGMINSADAAIVRRDILKLLPV